MVSSRAKVWCIKSMTKPVESRRKKEYQYLNNKIGFYFQTCREFRTNFPCLNNKIVKEK